MTREWRKEEGIDGYWRHSGTPGVRVSFDTNMFFQEDAVAWIFRFEEFIGDEDFVQLTCFPKVGDSWPLAGTEDMWGAGGGPVVDVQWKKLGDDLLVGKRPFRRIVKVKYAG